MLKNHTQYCLFRVVPAENGLGGYAVREERNSVFTGMDCRRRVVRAASAGAPGFRADTVIFHPPEVPLQPGDVVERMTDGARFRVCDGCVSDLAPADAPIALVQTLAERMVLR